MKKTKKFVGGKDRVNYGGAVIDHRELKAVTDTIKSNGGFTWTIGKKTKEFEAILAKYSGQDYAVLTNSGSSALLLSLLALELPKKSMVVIPATCFPTAYTSIVYAGLIPLVIDNDPKTFNIDPTHLEEVLNNPHYASKIEAVICVNIAGNVPDMEALQKICGRAGVTLILDNCDGFGGKFKDKPVESYADISCISLHAAHIISMGEGGAIITSDSVLDNKLRQYREWGREGTGDEPTKISTLPIGYPQRYSYPVLGLNLKPLELQSAIGIVQFSKLKKFHAIRTRNYNSLIKIFSKHSKVFEMVKTHPLADNCWFSFPLIVKNVSDGSIINNPRKKKFVEWLEKHNIETRPIFAGNILRHPISSYAVRAEGTRSDYPGADQVLANGMFIGLSPRTTPDMLKYVEQIVDEFVNNL